MSKTKPMAMGDRARSYVLQGARGRRFTPRQWKRLRQKHNRTEGSYYGHWGEICKNRPTPRRPRRG